MSGMALDNNIMHQENTESGQYYSSRVLPMASRCFYLHMNQIYDKHLSGVIRNLFFKGALPFNGLDEALLYMNRMMDEFEESGDSSEELRDFRTDRKKQIGSYAENRTMPEKMHQEREERFCEYMDKSCLDGPDVWNASFKIDIRYRRFNSWQGEITVLLPGRLKGKKECFRSVLELINLIRSAYKEILI